MNEQSIRNKVKFLSAKRLYVFQDKTAADVSKKVGVTEKTMGKWIADFNWKKEQADFIGEKLKHGVLQIDNLVMLEDLKAYLEDVTPFLYGQIKPAIDNYITLLNIQL